MIREAKLMDMNALLNVMFTYYAEANMQECDWDNDVVIRNLYAGINSPDIIVLVKEVGGEIVGFAYAEISSPLFSTDLILDCQVLYLLPAYRKGMAGVSMIKRLKGYAKASGAKYISLGNNSGVNEKRVGALYQKLGLTPYGNYYRGIV